MNPLSYSIPMAATATGLSQQSLRDAIHAGALKARRSSKDENDEPTGKFIILASDLQAFLEGLAAA